MTVAKVSLLALALTSGCLRFGYDSDNSDQKADASQPMDAGVHPLDAGTLDAAVSSNGGRGGSEQPRGGAGGAATAGQGGAGAGGSNADSGSAGAPADDEDAGVDVNQPVGDTGLRVNDILGYYQSPDWGEMVLETRGDEIWGAYEHDGGTIIGNVTSEGVFTGWWSQTPSRTGNDAGVVEFRWKVEDGITKLDGRWRWGTNGSWFENWDLSLITDHSAPSTLLQVFDHPADFRRHP